MKKIMAIIDGYKTQLVALTVLVIGGLKAYFASQGVEFGVPEYVWIILAGLGIGAARSALRKLENK